MSDSIYDRLVKLKDNEDLFNTECSVIMEEFISTLPENRQLQCRRTQWKLEQELKKYKDPLARYNQIVKLFFEQLSEFQDALNGNLTVMNGGEVPTQNAAVLEFKKKET